MRPVLFHVDSWAGSVGVPTHAFFVALGLLTAGAVFLVEGRRRGRLDEAMGWIVAGTLLGGAIGARLSTLWAYVDSAADPSVMGALADGGKSILGGLSGAYVGALVAKRILGYRRSTGDLFAPAVALGMAVGRVGCFLTEQVGTPTSMPWGIHLSPEAAARIPHCPWCLTGVAMHPSMLYEIAFHLVAFAVVLRLRGRLRTEGDVFKLYLLGYALFRFWVEFVRGSPEVVAGLTRPQLFLIPSSLLLVAYFARAARRPAPSPTLTPVTEP
ncbi:MAG: phosphatidylglycerol---prolipoprotein diacylglyceryl transferase [Actinomycetota bacterium]|nr:phosphatidylglycerol---prolipoprotein diacylglyceryl transferase [Actinomycetota bacterium]MEA2972556.1 phosphatidylglycerol---prolipoprotein diacylglyceryl transferase [Actinomycetota bacterium]